MNTTIKHIIIISLPFITWAIVSITLICHDKELNPKIYDTYYEYNIDNNYVNGQLVKTDTIAVDAIKIERK
jgi:hypothetical protein